MIDETDGIWTIEGDVCISKWVRESGKLDHDIWLMERLGPRLNGLRTALDIGAYIGDHTAAYADWFRLVVAFEPQEEAYMCLRHNLADRGNVLCFQAAVGAGLRSGRMDENSANPGSSRIIPCAGEIAFMDVTGIPDVDYIKIDVEGMEPLVLDACITLIERYHPRMLIEQRAADGNEGRVTAFLDSFGYKYEPIQGEGHEQYDLWCE